METNEELIKAARDYAVALHASVHVRHTGAELIDKLADALEAATTEWEWGAMWPDSCTGEPSTWGNREEVIRERVKSSPGMRLVRRRKAGPWEPLLGPLSVVLPQSGQGRAADDEPECGAGNDERGEPDGQVVHDRVEHAAQSMEGVLPLPGEVARPGHDDSCRCERAQEETYQEPAQTGPALLLSEARVDERESEPEHGDGHEALHASTLTRAVGALGSEPTPEQIEAAAIAFTCATREEWELSPDAYRDLIREDMRSALVAAAGAAPQVRECQCYGADGVTDQKCPACAALVDAIAGGTITVPGGYGELQRDDAESIVDALLPSLAALVQVDEAKLAEAVAEELESDDAVAEFWSSHKIDATARRLVQQAVLPALRGEDR